MHLLNMPFRRVPEAMAYFSKKTETPLKGFRRTGEQHAFAGGMGPTAPSQTKELQHENVS